MPRAQVPTIQACMDRERLIAAVRELEIAAAIPADRCGVLGQDDDLGIAMRLERIALEKLGRNASLMVPSETELWLQEIQADVERLQRVAERMKDFIQSRLTALSSIGRNL